MARKDSVGGSISDTEYFPEARLQHKGSPVEADVPDEIDSCMSPERLARLDESSKRHKETLRLLSE